LTLSGLMAWKVKLSALLLWKNSGSYLGGVMSS
jgi:hypothetical protein